MTKDKNSYVFVQKYNCKVYNFSDKTAYLHYQGQ